MKTSVYFWFNSAWYSIQPDIVREEQWAVEVGLIDGQNLLSVAKVICWRSLKWLKKTVFFEGRNLFVWSIF